VPSVRERSYYGKRHISQPVTIQHNPGLPSWGYVNDSVYITPLANIMIKRIELLLLSQ
jgi:hypothetical protein